MPNICAISLYRLNIFHKISFNPAYKTISKVGMMVNFMYQYNQVKVSKCDQTLV